MRGASTIDAIARAKGAGARVLAMAAEGSSDLYRTDLSGPVVLVFGNEAHGLPDDVAAPPTPWSASPSRAGRNR